MSELKSVSGSNKLPYGTLASGTEGIKDAISGFEDAYVFHCAISAIYSLHASRKSDIENERLPPDLYDADSEEGRALIVNSLPSTPGEDKDVPPVNLNGVSAGLESNLSSSGISPINTAVSNSPASSPSPATPSSPVSATSSPQAPFKRGHARQASLGTTTTSPSTRRRSIESTMSLIHGVWDGKEKTTISEQDEAVEGLAEKLEGSTVATGGAAASPASR